MTLDEALAALAGRGALPRDAMRWLLDRWKEAGPRLLSVLEDYASGDQRSEDAAEVAFFAASGGVDVLRRAGPVPDSGRRLYRP